MRPVLRRFIKVCSNQFGAAAAINRRAKDSMRCMMARSEASGCDNSPDSFASLARRMFASRNVRFKECSLPEMFASRDVRFKKSKQSAKQDNEAR
jgi:hypothetical protein